MAPLVVWCGIFYTMTLAGLVIPSFFLHKPDEPRVRTHEGTGLFKDREGDSKTTLQLYLLFMIPAMAALNSVFIYFVHYRHIRRQQYRIEVNEGDNLMFSTAARSLFADKRLRRRLKASRIEPLVLYEGYSGILPVQCKPTADNFTSTISSSVGVSASSAVPQELGASVFGIRLDSSVNPGTLSATTMRDLSMEGTVSGSPIPTNSSTALINAVESAKDWYTVEGAAAPSRLLKRLRGRVRPNGVSGHGPDSTFSLAAISPSDVKDLVAEAQLVNEASASIRYEISRAYAEVLGNNEIIREAVRQMQDERLRRLRRRRERSMETSVDTSVVMEQGEGEGGASNPGASASASRRQSDRGGDSTLPHFEAASSHAPYGAESSTGAGGGEAEGAGGVASRVRAARAHLDNPIRKLVRNYQSLSPQQRGGVWGEREANGQQKRRRQSEVTVLSPLSQRGQTTVRPLNSGFMAREEVSSTGGAQTSEGSSERQPSSPPHPIHMRMATLEGAALNNSNPQYNLTVLSNTAAGGDSNANTTTNPLPPTALQGRQSQSAARSQSPAMSVEQPAFSRGGSVNGSRGDLFFSPENDTLVSASAAKGGGRAAVGAGENRNNAADLFASATAQYDSRRRELSMAATLSEAASEVSYVADGGNARREDQRSPHPHHRRTSSLSGPQIQNVGRADNTRNTSQWVMEQQQRGE